MNTEKRPHPPRWLVEIWQHCTFPSLFIEGSVSWNSWNDQVHERKLDWEIRFPKVLWRPYCWLHGHDQYYSECIWCGKPMSYPPRA